MGMKSWLLIFVCCLPGGRAAAQVGQDVLRSALLGKQMYLRGFSLEPIVRAHWEGGVVIMDDPRVRTVGVFIAKSVKVRGDKVEIGGGAPDAVAER